MTWLYIMIHCPFIWWVKIGITGKKRSARAKQIDRAVIGFPIPVAAVPLPGAYNLEQRLHRILSPLSCRFYLGDGSTEWFWIVAAVPVLVVMAAIWAAYAFGIYLLYHLLISAL